MEINMKILIKGGQVIDPANNIDENMDVLVADGIIAKIDKCINESDVVNGKTDEELRVIDASGLKIMPGFVDLHVHLREPGFEYKETVMTGADAAAHGGVTSICPMPNTNPVIDSPEAVKDLLERSNEAKVHILPVGAVTIGQSGEKLADIDGMKNAGIVAVSEDGKSVMNTAVYMEGLKAAAKAGIPVLAHCEDKPLVRGGVMNESEKSRQLGLKGITNTVEDVIVARDILMSKEAGNHIHLCHCSTRLSASLVKWAKSEGMDVSAEVCPHHFTMSDDEITEDNGRFKMNPPLRSKEDVESLKLALKDSTMEVISTDHAPHGKEEKDQSMAKAPFGITGLETSFALGMTELVRTGILTLSQLVERMSMRPAQIIHIDKGNLAQGKCADIAIADIDHEYVIDSSEFVSKGKNTPFDGKKVYGKIVMTIVDGKIVFEA